MPSPHQIGLLLFLISWDFHLLQRNLGELPTTRAAVGDIRQWLFIMLTVWAVLVSAGVPPARARHSCALARRRAGAY
jgi:hypothetical protein